MKRVVLYLLLVALCPCACFAALGDADDGFLTEGEYDYAVDWTSYEPALIVDGGGAEWIEVSDFGRIEVISTSTPLGIDIGGIMDIALTDNSQLLFLDGITGEITIGKDATMTLEGGQVNHIRSQQHVSGTGNITIECQPEWEWLYTSSDITGISGLWANDDVFTINFFDDGTGYYDPTWENINITEIPEPATLLLLGMGAVAIRRKRRA